MDQTLTAQPSLEQTIAPLINERQRLSQIQKPYGKDIDKLSDQVKRAMIDQFGELEIIVKDDVGKRWKVTVDPYAERKTLSREKLIQAGVPVETVNACTDTTYYEKIDVREVKGDE